jgi:hypothetical protein
VRRIGGTNGPEQKTRRSENERQRRLAVALERTDKISFASENTRSLLLISQGLSTICGDGFLLLAPGRLFALILSSNDFSVALMPITNQLWNEFRATLELELFLIFSHRQTVDIYMTFSTTSTIQYLYIETIVHNVSHFR